MQYREKKNYLFKNQVPCKFVHTTHTHTTSSLPLNFKGTVLKLLIQLCSYRARIQTEFLCVKIRKQESISNKSNEQ